MTVILTRWLLNTDINDFFHSVSGDIPPLDESILKTLDVNHYEDTFIIYINVKKTVSLKHSVRGGSNFIESSFESSFELLEFLLDDILLQQ